MIAKGNVHSNGAKLGQYLVTGKDGEAAELYELRGFAEADIVDAFRSVHVMARGTQCEQPFFHCQIRNPAGEQLERGQWEKVVERLEEKLGLGGQPRAIAFHKKDGHEHMHVAWSRIDGETLKAIPQPFFKLRLKEACRELEMEFGLTLVRNERDAKEPKAPRRGERDQSRRLGVDVDQVRAQIRAAWEQSDSGKSFAAALGEQGMTIAHGDRRDYVVVDRAGGLHALGKRILGVSAAEIRDRLADLPPDLIPTIAEARGHARALRDLEAETERVRGRHANDRGGLVAQEMEAHRRHLDLNPFLKQSNEDNEAQREQLAREVAEKWSARRQQGRDRDR